MIKRILYIIVLINLYHGQISGQDVSFSQFYANPLYLNPAFAGSVSVPRVALQYRNQWHSFNNAYSTYSFAFDAPVKALQGGIGFNVLSDIQADGLLKSLQFNLAYSVYIKLSRNYRLYGGIQAGLHSNMLNVGDLVFADNLDPNFGNHGTTAEVFSDPTYNYPDFSTGFIVFSEKVFYGLAAHHLTEPQQTYYRGSENPGKLYRKYSAHFGARLPVYRHGHLRKKFDVSPQIVMQKQADFYQLNYGIFATKFGMTGGAWFRQNFGLRYDAVILLIGFVKSNIQITYSYDLTISGLWGDSGGTSEISVAFLLKEIKKKNTWPFFSPYREKFGSR
ncbi:MAG: PorP/SprF family type IX secretion system membrane protein [Draconibacterium sp.]|nr:PorP/SprF family type IX secretion system membrane protein [Draconibacterium sp.]